MENQDQEKQIFIGIRREDKSCWQRRTALIPSHITEIQQKYPQIEFIVQPSTYRVFADSQYEEAGAKIDQDITKCQIIIGVKEIPNDKLYAGKTYLFFSHTIKGQPQNMNMLDDILKKQIRLIDYERITTPKDQRLVAFGRFAGIAGAIDFLAGFGIFLLKSGFNTPFLNINYSYKYYDIESAFASIQMIALNIQQVKLPQEICPLVFANVGKGRCGSGTLEVLELFNIQMIDPNDLHTLFVNPNDPAHREIIYVTSITQEHMVKENNGKPLDQQHYYNEPGSYCPIFHEKYLPYISVIFNNIYWDQRFPRLIDDEQMKELCEQQRSRLLGVADVTCDQEGSIEFLKQFTTPDKPFFIWDPVKKEVLDEIDFKPNYILYLALDFLPCELANDASVHFSSYIKTVIPNIAFSDPSQELEKQGLIEEIQRAVIAYNGDLAPQYQYIQNIRKINELKQLSNQYDEKKAISPLQRKVSSFMAFRIKGHLFDSMAINRIFDICQANGVKFNIMDLIAGNDEQTPSQCVLQIFDNGNHNLMDAIEMIMELADEKKLDIRESGSDNSPR